MHNVDLDTATPFLLGGLDFCGAICFLNLEFISKTILLSEWIGKYQFELRIQIGILERSGIFLPANVMHWDCLNPLYVVEKEMCNRLTS